MFGHEFPEELKEEIIGNLTNIETTTLFWKNGFASYCIVYNGYNHYLTEQIRMNLREYILEYKRTTIPHHGNLGKEIEGLKDIDIEDKNKALKIRDSLNNNQFDLHSLDKELI